MGVRSGREQEREVESGRGWGRGGVGAPGTAQLAGRARREGRGGGTKAAQKVNFFLVPVQSGHLCSHHAHGKDKTESMLL